MTASAAFAAINIHRANKYVLLSMFDGDSTSTQTNDNAPSTFFSIAGLCSLGGGGSGGKSKNEPSTSVTMILEPILQTKLLIIQRNPVLFQRMHERLRQGETRFSKHRQVMEIHNFLNSMMIVAVREEIKNHHLVKPDTKKSVSSALRRSSFCGGAKKTTWSSTSIEMHASSDDFTFDSEARWNPGHFNNTSSATVSPRKKAGRRNSLSNATTGVSPRPFARRNSLTFFGDGAKSKTHTTSPNATVLHPLSIKNQLHRSRNEYDRFDVEDYVGSTSSGSLGGDDCFSSRESCFR